MQDVSSEPLNSSVPADEKLLIVNITGEKFLIDKRARRFSILRLVTFLGFVVGLFLAFDSRVYLFIISLPSFLAFLFALIQHNKLLEQSKVLHCRRLLLEESHERKTNRRRTRHPPALETSQYPLDTGKQLFLPEVPHFELDSGVIEDFNLLEGNRTLFAFLDVSSTLFGSRRLHYLMTHLLSNVKDITDRQEAVKEIASNKGTRQMLLEQLVKLRSYNFDTVAQFLQSPTIFKNKPFSFIIVNVMGTLTPVAIIMAFFMPPLMFISILLFVLNMTLIFTQAKKTNPLRDQLFVLGPLIKGLIEIQETMDKTTFESKLWKNVKATLTTLLPAASQLKRHIGLLEFQSFGVVFEIFNMITLWELRILPLAERVLKRHHEILEKSVGALGETETLISLACPLVEQENFCMPQPLDEMRPCIHAEQMGHPLIETESLVANSANLRTGDNVWIITGSNMSGKSTFLKSVGINIVLAGMGGPVCSQAFRWTPVELYSDINIKDSLDDGKSYFQVEVERVLQIIFASNRSTRVLAIFDELFRGTNSRERLAISRAILKYLRSREILLLVATHDNSLTHLVTEEREEGMSNHHLQEEVKEKTMIFDYKLREGPATTQNAIRVLEVSNYPTEITESARAEGAN